MLAHRLRGPRLFLLGLLTCGSGLPAQAMKLVANLERGPAPWPGATVTQVLGTVGGVALFAMHTVETGFELFATTGQPGSARLVRDINPYGHSNPHDLVTIGGRAFFWADDGEHGFEPWISDGTPGGTQLVKDIRPGARAAQLSSAVQIALQARVVFVASDGEHGFEPWISDGTAAGTSLLADINPGAAGSNVRSFVQVRGIAYFVAWDGSEQNLWRTDGTRGGTWRLAPHPGAGPSAPERLVVDEASGLLYFLASARDSGHEWWRSDGTPAGTGLLVDLVPGPLSPTVGDAAAAGGRLFFAAAVGNQVSTLWCVDSGPSGARVVRDPLAGGPREPTNLFSCEDRILFVASSAAEGAEPWVSDGTEAGTHLLADLTPGPVGFSAGSFFKTGAGDVLFFSPPGNSPGIWRTDLTAAGTRRLLRDGLLRDVSLAPHPDGSRTLLGGQLNGVAQIWETDGTVAGTRAVVMPWTWPLDGGADYKGLGSLAGQGLFAVGGSRGRPLDLWRSDGTEIGTRRVADLVSATGGSVAWPVGALPGRRLFMTGEAAGVELWATDGSAVGTSRLLPAGARLSLWGSSCARFHLFAASDSGNGSEPWVTDGTPSGTRLLLDVTRGVDGSSPGPSIAVDEGHAVFLTRYGSPAYWTLWWTDGTPTGTRAIHTSPVLGLSESLFAAAGRAFLFEFDRTGRVATMSATDGSTSGMRLIAVGVTPLGSTRDAMLFVDAGNTIWRTDGTAAGTRSILTLSRSRYPVAGCELGGAYLFADGDGVTAVSTLWLTDGTAAGTRAFAEVPLGFVRAEPLGSGRAALYMVSPSGSRTILFATDGTAQGTRHLGNVNGDVLVAQPTANGLLVVHDDGVLGSELWVMDVGATSYESGPDCAGPGRHARLTVDDPVLGATIAITGTGVPSPALAALFVASPVLPQPRVGPCVLAGEGMQVLVAFATGAGSWTSRVRLPSLGSLLGLRLALQAAWGPTDAPLGVDVSNVVTLTFGR